VSICDAVAISICVKFQEKNSLKRMIHYNITYFQVLGRPSCDLEIFAMAAMMQFM